jgi:hypothetical protein
VFYFDGTSWTQEAYLKARVAGPGDKFGSSVSIVDQWTVVGAPFERSCSTGVNGTPYDLNCSDSGAAYVFENPGAAWGAQAYVKSFAPSPNSKFASSLALTGSVLVVGAISESSCAVGVNGNTSTSTCSHSGAAYVLRRASLGWVSLMYLKPIYFSLNDTLFGASVAVADSRIAVGADGFR